ncbi:(Fe-S)-binding protein [Lysobacter panacisoli]|uniref:(Fe-S)-binding protein n=1 Tax=Lysobacter panacisoli TaxID=1255263 RepID=UPI0031EDFFDF
MERKKRDDNGAAGPAQVAGTPLLESGSMPASTREPGPTDPLVALADRCVQCGLCLPACPTYGLERNEAESPRGRIALARAWALETLDPTATGDAHLDHCLGCRSCEAVCPAGVKYGALLAAARERQRKRRPAGWRTRLLEGLVTRPALLAAALGLYRTLHAALPSRWRPVPRPPRGPVRPAAINESSRVALFTGCVAKPYETGVRDAVVRLCGALGVAVAEPNGQGCCGSLHAHAGNNADAARLAERNRTAFARAETVLTLASGCHESVSQSLSSSTRTIDALEFLAERLAQAPDTLRWRTTDETIALHLPCTQRNVVRSVPAMRRLLAAVPGLRVIELDSGFGCCGAAGLQMIEDPERAAQFREPLLRSLDASGATRLLSANIGCRLHLGNGTTIPVQHPLEFLAGCLDPESSPHPGASDA